jgi:hypothetical protein
MADEGMGGMRNIKVNVPLHVPFSCWSAMVRGPADPARRTRGALEAQIADQPGGNRCIGFTTAISGRRNRNPARGWPMKSAP